MSIITLTTDFGAADWFVGTLKGVILRINPQANIVDITHDIPAGDIRAGAFALAAGYRYFPTKTIHVAVVDPGVGSRRRAIAVQTANCIFVGPDNGVLSFALAKEKIKTVHELTNEKLFLKPISQTFHGRDIFAPVAAHFSRGLSIQTLGPPLKDPVRLRWPEPRFNRTSVSGEVVYIDRFGNAIVNIDHDAVSGLAMPAYEILVKDKHLCPLAAFYQAVPAGRPVAVIGSSGLLEIAINGGSAAQRLKLNIGDAVSVRRRTRHPDSSSST